MPEPTRFPERRGTIVDCLCGRRYFQRVVDEEISQEGHVLCDCGYVLGAWSGKHRLIFENEETRVPKQT